MSGAVGIRVGMQFGAVSIGRNHALSCAQSSRADRGACDVIEAHAWPYTYSNTYDSPVRLAARTGSKGVHNGCRRHSEQGHVRRRPIEPQGRRARTTMLDEIYATDDPVNETDPSGLYSYEYSWDLGQVGTPLTVFKYFSTHLHSVFPFTTGTCGSLYLGEHCDFHPTVGPVKTDDHLHVSYLTSDSVTLEVTTWCQIGWAGHACLAGDPKGSTIHFLVYTLTGLEGLGHQCAGEKTDVLSQIANSTGAGIFTNRGAPMLALSTWHQQADNLERGVGGKTSDVPLITTLSSPPTILGYH